MGRKGGSYLIKKSYCPFCEEITEHKRKDPSKSSRLICQRCRMGTVPKKLKYDPERSGDVYLLRSENNETLYDIIGEMTSLDKKIFFVTRKNPGIIEQKHDLKEDNLVWYVIRDTESAVTDGKLNNIIYRIKNFFSSDGDFLFVDGLNYFFENHHSSRIIRFLQTIEERTIKNGVKSLLVFSPSSVREKHLSWIRSELELNNLLRTREKRKILETLLERDLSEEREAQGELYEEKGFEELETETMKKALKELNFKFQIGELSVDEYISKRSQLVNEKANKDISFQKSTINRLRRKI